MSHSPRGTIRRNMRDTDVGKGLHDLHPDVGERVPADPADDV